MSRKLNKAAAKATKKFNREQDAARKAAAGTVDSNKKLDKLRKAGLA